MCVLKISFDFKALCQETHLCTHEHVILVGSTILIITLIKLTVAFYVEQVG